MAVHALYDDTPLGAGASSAIGSLLRDETEAGAIDVLVAAIEAVFAESGDPDDDDRPETDSGALVRRVPLEHAALPRQRRATHPSPLPPTS